MNPYRNVNLLSEIQRPHTCKYSVTTLSFSCHTPQVFIHYIHIHSIHTTGVETMKYGTFTGLCLAWMLAGPAHAEDMGMGKALSVGYNFQMYQTDNKLNAATTDKEMKTYNLISLKGQHESGDMTFYGEIYTKDSTGVITPYKAYARRNFGETFSFNVGLMVLNELGYAQHRPLHDRYDRDGLYHHSQFDHSTPALMMGYKTPVGMFKLQLLQDVAGTLTTTDLSGGNVVVQYKEAKKGITSFLQWSHTWAGLTPMVQINPYNAGHGMQWTASVKYNAANIYATLDVTGDSNKMKINGTERKLKHSGYNLFASANFNFLRPYVKYVANNRNDDYARQTTAQLGDEDIKESLIHVGVHLLNFGGNMSGQPMSDFSPYIAWQQHKVVDDKDNELILGFNGTF